MWWCYGMKKQPLMAIEWGYKGISSWIRLTMINPFGRWSSIHYLYYFGRWFLYPFMYLGISMAWDWLDDHTPYAMTRLHMSVWVKVKDPGESLWVTQFYNAQSVLYVPFRFIFECLFVSHIQMMRRIQCRFEGFGDLSMGENSFWFG